MSCRGSTVWKFLNRFVDSDKPNRIRILVWLINTCNIAHINPSFLEFVVVVNHGPDEITPRKVGKDHSLSSFVVYIPICGIIGDFFGQSSKI